MKELLKRLFPIESVITRWLLRLYNHLFMQTLYYLFRVFPLKSNKIVLSNFNGNGYGDNLKYIAEEIIFRNLSCDLVWMLSVEFMNNSSMPNTIRRVRNGSLKSIYEMVTAKVWIDNVRKPFHVKKRKGQYYIQTWHGAPALKRVESDVKNLSVDYVKSAQTDSKKIDLFLSNCRLFTDLVKSSFWYSGEVLECGSPRNDVLLSDQNVLPEKVREAYGISEKQRIVLYAPTFRLNNCAKLRDLDIEQCLKSLSKRFTGEWGLMVRLHPNVQHESNSLLLKEHVINVTSYEDLQELLVAVDVVITDYSSLMFDSALQRKPVFLYCPDFESYKVERNFYFTFDELPFTFATDNETLIKNILRFDQNSYLNCLDGFFKRVGLCERGRASKTVVDIIETQLKQVPYEPEKI